MIEPFAKIVKINGALEYRSPEVILVFRKKIVNLAIEFSIEFSIFKIE